MLQPFAKASDLLILAPALDEATATLALDLVSGVIRSAVGWDVDQQALTYTKYVSEDQDPHPLRYAEYRGSWYSSRSTKVVVVPALNLTAVTKLMVDDVQLTADQFHFTTAGVIRFDVHATDHVDVEYTAGYVRVPDRAPPIFRAVALEYAIKMATNPVGVRSYNLGGAAAVSETFADNGLRSLVEDDLRLDPYKIT